MTITGTSEPAILAKPEIEHDQARLGAFKMAIQLCPA
jgi:hypothetical protein